MRLRLRLPKFVRPIAYALLALTLLVCATEIVLRVRDSMQWRTARPRTDGDGLVVPSWTVHHELKPLRRVEFVNPDDQSRVAVRTNSFGLRGGEPAVPKSPGVFRILVLGDEIVLGPDVAEDEALTERLAGLLGSRADRRIEVLNAGVPGDCPLLSYLRLRHSLASLRPDVVVVTFDMGDVADDYHLRRHVEVDDGNVPVACPNPVLRRLEESQRSDVDWFLLPRLAKEAMERWTLRDGGGDARSIDSPRGRFGWIQEQRSDWDVYVNLAFSAFDRLKDACDEMGATLVVVVHPAPWQVSSTAGSENLRESLGVGANDHYRGREPFDRLGRYLAERGIAFCDGSEAFRSDPKPESLYLVNAARFSTRGHELHARVLATYLVRRVPGPWTESTPAPSVPGRSLEARRGEPPAR